MNACLKRPHPTVPVEWWFSINRPFIIYQTNSFRSSRRSDWCCAYDIAIQPRQRRIQGRFFNITQRFRQSVLSLAEIKPARVVKSGVITTLPLPILNLEGNESKPSVTALPLVESTLSHGFTVGVFTD